MCFLAIILLLMLNLDLRNCEMLTLLRARSTFNQPTTALEYGNLSIQSARMFTAETKTQKLRSGVIQF